MNKYSHGCWLAVLLMLGCTAAQGAPAKSAAATKPAGIRLIVRGDDLGALHGIDEGAEKAFTQGIMTVAHVIVPGPWFPEAVRILKEHPEVDVGIHLAITSEWSNVKWRPLTHAPSLVDEDGFFRPFIWPNKELPGASHKEAGTWNLEEIEAELRAQIELIKKRLPRVSNGGCHMGCDSLDPKVKDLIARLLREYGLNPDTSMVKPLPIERAKGRPGNALSLDERVDALVKALQTVGPGDYNLVEHPATNDPEMKAIAHPGYENVAEDRASVTALWTSPKVKEAIAQRGIKLIGYRDLPKKK